MKLTKTSNKGFTIIEVLIVLTIAASILLVVLISVPALRRNSTNNQRRAEMSRYAGAVSEWASNNNGNLPTTLAQLTTASSGVNALAGAFSIISLPTTAAGVNTTAVAVDVNGVITGINPGITVTNNTTTTSMLYVPGTICGTGVNLGNATSTGGSPRSFTILWSTENSTGAETKQCTAS